MLNSFLNLENALHSTTFSPRPYRERKGQRRREHVTKMQSLPKDGTIQIKSFWSTKYFRLLKFIFFKSLFTLPALRMSQWSIAFGFQVCTMYMINCICIVNRSFVEPAVSSDMKVLNVVMTSNWLNFTSNPNPISKYSDMVTTWEKKENRINRHSNIQRFLLNVRSFLFIFFILLTNESFLVVIFLIVILLPRAHMFAYAYAFVCIFVCSFDHTRSTLLLYLLLFPCLLPWAR